MTKAWKAVRSKSSRHCSFIFRIPSAETETVSSCPERKPGFIDDPIHDRGWSYSALPRCLAILGLMCLCAIIPYGAAAMSTPVDANFGAKGDGVADDTAALLAWAATLNRIHGRGTLPCGTFIFRRTLVFGGDVDVRGLGACSILRYEGEGDAILVTAVLEGQPTGSAGNDHFADFQLVRPSKSLHGAGIRLQNASDFILSDLRIHDFFQGVRVEGGNAGTIRHLEARAGTFYDAIIAESASIAVEPYFYAVAGQATFACPNSLSISEPDIGGNDANHFLEAGLKITCVDGLYLGTGHIGAAQNDVEITRMGGRHMNVQSVEIGGFLDGSKRAVYVAPPSGGSDASGMDSSGGGTVHLRIKAFQIANQTGNAIEIDDPSTDVGILDVDIAHVEGWGVFAPRVGKLAVSGSKFETIGHAAQGTGGILVGMSSGDRVSQKDRFVPVQALTIIGNQFFGVKNCIVVSNVSQSIVESNLVHDCAPVSLRR